MRVPNFAAMVLLLVGCGRAATPTRSTANYVPTTRAISITTVPLLVKELVKAYPFLAKDFAPGGVRAGKEVYGFSPSTITVVSGDTLRLTLLNPEDDDHAFVLRDFFVKLPPQSRTAGTEFSGTIPGGLPNLAVPPPGCRFAPRCNFATDECRRAQPALRELEPGHKVACIHAEETVVQ